MKTLTDVNELIRGEVAKALTDGPKPDFDQIAKNVVAQIPAEDIPDVLLIMVRKQIQRTTHVDRRDILRGVGVGATARKGHAEKMCAEPRLQLPQPGPSRWSQSVPRWQRVLDTLVHIEGRGSAPKRLGSCTVPELTVVAQARFDLAKANTAEGTRYAKLIEAMQVEKVGTPDDLSPATLERFAQNWPTA